jgi:hypothetical protein
MSVLETLEEQTQRLADAAKDAASNLGRTSTWVHLQCPNGPHKFGYLGKSQNAYGVKVEYECMECQIGATTRFYVAVMAASNTASRSSASLEVTRHKGLVGSCEPPWFAPGTSTT